MTREDIDDPGTTQRVGIPALELLDRLNWRAVVSVGKGNSSVLRSVDQYESGGSDRVQDQFGLPIEESLDIFAVFSNWNGRYYQLSPPSAHSLYMVTSSLKLANTSAIIPASSRKPRPGMTSGIASIGATK